MKRVPSHLEEAVLRAAEAAFPPGNAQGVYAMGIAPKRKGGRNLGYSTLRLKVARKARHDGPELPPIEVLDGTTKRTVTPDIVATGAPAKTAYGVEAVLTGLHAGAPIVSRLSGGAGSVGAVGCFAAGDDGELYVVTCGHTFERGSVEESGDRGDVYCAAYGDDPVVVGVLAANLLDLAPSGEAARDLAAIRLNDAGLDLYDRTAPVFDLLGVVPEGGLDGVAVTAFRPTCDDFTAPFAARRRPTVTYLYCEQRDELLRLPDLVEVEGMVTWPGDSGTSLVAVSGRELAGTCSGGDADTSWFECADGALARLAAALDTHLVLRRN